MNLNRADIIGRLSQPPESKKLENGMTVTRFSVATNRAWTDKDNQKHEEVEYHNIVVFGALAENVQRYLGKGDTAYVTGRLQTRRWKNHDGTTGSRTEIVAENVQFGPKMTRGAIESVQRDETGVPEQKTLPRGKIEATGHGLGPGYNNLSYNYPEPGKNGNPDPDEIPF
jgi:single-strand DNA-binding protein